MLINNDVCEELRCRVYRDNFYLHSVTVELKFSLLNQIKQTRSLDPVRSIIAKFVFRFIQLIRILGFPGKPSSRLQLRNRCRRAARPVSVFNH